MATPLVQVSCHNPAPVTVSPSPNSGAGKVASRSSAVLDSALARTRDWPTSPLPSYSTPSWISKPSVYIAGSCRSVVKTCTRNCWAVDCRVVQPAARTAAMTSAATNTSRIVERQRPCGTMGVVIADPTAPHADLAEAVELARAAAQAEAGDSPVGEH